MNGWVGEWVAGKTELFGLENNGKSGWPEHHYNNDILQVFSLCHCAADNNNKQVLLQTKCRARSGEVCAG